MGITLFGAQASFAMPADREALVTKLHDSAPAMNREVLTKAVSAMECAVGNGMQAADRLAVIDFSLPSSQPRLWLFDLKKSTLLLEDLVAHGQKSGDKYATSFSNEVGSHQSSIGLFRAQESYQGKNGYSLRLDGLEPGFNDRARERAIVIHGADYVAQEWVDNRGHIGRSHGCPAVAQGVAKMVIDELKNGQFVFSYYPDQDWLASSAFLNCDSQRVASSKAVANDS